MVSFVKDYKTGVCRHYASAATLLYRALGIPARYTEGVMVKAVAGKDVVATALDAHAWVEVYDKGYWFGFDPTNNQEVDHQYIKISHGRDYSDCMVIKGLFRGNALQSQDIKVCVEIEGQE